MAGSKFIFRGEVLAPIHSSYASLILPVVALKKFLQTLHQLIVKLLWSELIEGKTSDQFLTIIVFLILCTLSLLAYYSRAASGMAFLLCCLLWLTDYSIAKGQFLNTNHVLPVTLECCSDWVVWQRHSHQIEHIKFQRTAVAQISIARTLVKAGAFQEVLGSVWQVYLTLTDRTELLIHEAHNPVLALAKADQLSQYFAVPLIVLSSEGAGKYAAAPLDLLADQPKDCPTIHCQKFAQQWHIYSQWRASSTWRLLGESFGQFGFLLFAVITTNLMILFGGLLHTFGLAWFSPIRMTQVDFSHPLLRWQAILELLLALSLMIFKGAQLSREEHLYVTPATLTFMFGRKQIGELATPEIKTVLFLKQPFPTLLILAEDRAIEVRELQHETEFRTMLMQLQLAILNLCQLKPDAA